MLGDYDVCKLCGNRGFYENNTCKDCNKDTKPQKTLDIKRLRVLLGIIKDNYAQHQKPLKKGVICRCEVCQALWLLR